jgi:hypothetical protein
VLSLGGKKAGGQIDIMLWIERNTLWYRYGGFFVPFSRSMLLPFRIHEPLTTLDVEAAYCRNFKKNQLVNEVLLRFGDWRTIPSLVSAVATDNSAAVIVARQLVR